MSRYLGQPIIWLDTVDLMKWIVYLVYTRPRALGFSCRGDFESKLQGNRYRVAVTKLSIRLQESNSGGGRKRKHNKKPATPKLTCISPWIIEIFDNFNNWVHCAVISICLLKVSYPRYLALLYSKTKHRYNLCWVNFWIEGLLLVSEMESTKTVDVVDSVKTECEVGSVGVSAEDSLAIQTVYTNLTPVTIQDESGLRQVCTFTHTHMYIYQKGARFLLILHITLSIS